jgi:hypothetical protein
LVSSRQTAASRSAPKAPARSPSAAVIRCGASKKTSVRGSAASSRSRDRRPEPLRGRKPSKQNRSLGSPDSARAVVTALGPGAAVTGKPASSAARTSR